MCCHYGRLTQTLHLTAACRGNEWNLKLEMSEMSPCVLRSKCAVKILMRVVVVVVVMMILTVRITSY
jgi:hypothetical protein